MDTYLGDVYVPVILAMLLQFPVELFR